MDKLGKRARQAMLLELLQSGGAPSQEELRSEFRRLGHEVSQITLSRDLRELGAVKAPGADGRRYALASAAPAPQGGEAALRRVLREFGRGMEAAGQFVVIKTPPSGAPPVALAVDQAGFPEVAGTIAGDDTVFILARSDKQAEALLKRLQSF